MSRNVRRLAGSDLSTVSQLIELAKKADLVQVVAIGVGLAERRRSAVDRPQACGRYRGSSERAGIPALASAFAAGTTSFEVVDAGGAGAAGALQTGGKPASGGGSPDHRSLPAVRLFPVQVTGYACLYCCLAVPE